MRPAYGYSVLETSTQGDWVIVQLPTQCLYVEITIRDNDALFGFSFDGEEFGDDLFISLFLDTTPVPLACRAYRYKSDVGAPPARIWVRVYY